MCFTTSHYNCCFLPAVRCRFKFVAQLQCHAFSFFTSCCNSIGRFWRLGFYCTSNTKPYMWERRQRILYWTLLDICGKDDKDTLLDICGKDDKEYFTGHMLEGRQRDFIGHMWERRQRILYWTYVGKTTKNTLLDICWKDDKETLLNIC